MPSAKVAINYRIKTLSNAKKSNTMLVLLLLPLLVFMTESSWAKSQTRPVSRYPLYFEATKNNVTVAPQKFEYSMLNQDQVQIGDILIDANELKFDFEQVDQKTVRFNFSWPAGLLTSGSLVIKDQTGKALYSGDIDKEKITIRSPPSVKPNLRSEVASFKSEPVKSSIIDEIGYLPFITFCVYRKEESNEVNLCSKELYLSSQESTPQIKARTSTPKDAFVQINGKEVGLHGVIFLYNKDEQISFRAQSQSGAFIEILTVRENIEFIDTLWDPKTEKVQMLGRGAAPIDDSLVTWKQGDMWRINIPQSQPTIYLKAHGDIPLRQDLVFKGTLPHESLRPYVMNKIDLTYDSIVTLKGRRRPNTQLSNIDDNSDLQQNKNDFTWTLKNLAKRSTNRNHLKITHKEDEFYVLHELYRGAPSELSLSLSSPISYASNIQPEPSVSPTSLSGQLKFGRWWSQFLGIDSELTRLRWGTYAQYTSQTQQDPAGLPQNTFNLDLYYRLNPGVHTYNSSSGLSLSYRSETNNSLQTNYLGVGFFLSHNWSKDLSWLGEWLWAQMTLYPITEASTLDSGSAFNVFIESRYYFTPTYYFAYHLNYGSTEAKSLGSTKQIYTNSFSLGPSGGMQF